METDYIKVDHVSTDRLLAELERRQRDEPGSWTGRQGARIQELASKLAPAFATPPAGLIYDR